MLISVVISTHNRLDSLKKLLISLSNQTLDASEYEVIVVDSPAGIDCSATIFETTKPNYEPRLILAPNILSAKRNVGAHESVGNLIVFLDDDMEVDKDFLEMHVSAHTDPKTVISGGILFPEAWVRQSNYYRYKSVRHKNSKLISQTDSHRFVAMNFSISREEFYKTGGFDESFTGYGGEDVEYGIRLARLGMQHKMCTEAYAVHAEVKMSPLSFSKKIKNASLWTPHLLNLAPESKNIKTVKFTEPNIQRSLLESTVYAIVSVSAKLNVEKFIGWYLEKTDGVRIAYSPLLFKLLTLVSTKQGIIARKFIQNKDFIQASD